MKDINTTAGASSTSVELSAGPGLDISYPLFFGFHLFNNKLYFNATDGISIGEVWSTDGTTANTTLLKDTVPTVFDPFNPVIPFILLTDAVNLPSRFIFPVSDANSIYELWESDGTPVGTKVFMSFTPNDPADLPFIFVPYSYNFTAGTYSQPLFMGNKFFFIASNTTAGYELWISDGTVGGTSIVKDINPGAANGIDADNSISYLYTATNLFFAATDATHGNELWKTDGTSGGTTMVKGINPNAGHAAPQLSIITDAGTIFFTATDGNHPTNRDLFVVDGMFQALPLKLTDFFVNKNSSDAILQWTTSREINSKNFIVQRSYDAMHFENIGTVQAAGNSAGTNSYNFTDIGIMNSGKSNVYYRLLLTDADGKSVYSKIVLLKLEPGNDWTVRLLSNPIRGNVNVLLGGITGNLRLSIKDISGKTIFTNNYPNVNGQITLNANIPSGTYLLVAENNNERRVLKFIK